MRTNDWLIVQSIGASPDDRFRPYMDLAGPVHEEYARRCGADYLLFAGTFEEPALNPTWNRLPLMFEAFDAGYRKVFWMDADTLAVQLDRNVFAETPDAPLLMTRVDSSHVEMPWRESVDAGLRSVGLCGVYRFSPAEMESCCLPFGHVEPAHASLAGESWTGPQWDVYNDGVLMATNCPEARAALEFAWAHRRAPFEAWHVPGMPELDWILDYVYDHPEVVTRLHERWNWQHVDQCPREEACIMAWHGEMAQRRWHGFRTAWEEFYG